MTRLTADWLTAAPLQDLFTLFAAKDYRLYAVGGCVRNSLMNAPTADIDLATDATPEDVIELCDTAGLKVIPTGLAHGTVTILSRGTSYEVTTFRSDVSTDGRHAVVAYSANLEEDAKRRDFTINALYAEADGTVHDPVGGMPDIAASRVRFIGDASARIAEDYLRILRFFRFYAWYGDVENGIDAEGLAACAQAAEGLEQLSRERVGAEMTKLLAAPDPAPAIAAMSQAGILARVTPGADHGALAVLVHLEGGISPDWIRRAAVLGGEDIKDHWRISKADGNRLALLREGLANAKPAAELAFRHGASHARDVALVTAAAIGQPLPENLTADIALGAAAVFPIRSADLMPQFSGPALGAELKRLENQWIASEFTLTRADLLGQ